jgi:pimeloyl-ACP methyl ester carboxylesterase
MLRRSHPVGAGTRQQLKDAMLGIPHLLRHPVWRPTDPDQGGGLGVLLNPGFGVGDRSLSLAGAWLRARGYRPVGAGVGINVGCTTDLVEHIEHRLEEHAEATGRRVVLVGQSRGGWLGRVAASRRPDLVRGVVMLGSPVLDPLGAHPRVIRAARFLARLSSIGVPGLLNDECFTGACFRGTMDALMAPLPMDVPVLTVYSRCDSVVPWHLCLDPGAECVEVRSTHTGMGFDPDFYTALEPRLAKWAAADDIGGRPAAPAA